MAEIALVAATAVINQAVSMLGNQVVKEGSRLFKLTQDMEWIEKQMGYMQAYLEDSDANDHEQQGRSKVEATLVIDIRVLACDAEDIVETYFHQIATEERKGGLHGWLKSTSKFILNYKAVRDFAVEIEGIKRRIEDIKNARQTFPIRERSGRGDTWDSRRAWPHIDEAHVVGFDEHIEELVTKVLNEDLLHDVVSITGMPGLGKTTLARKVYNSVRGKFQCSAWIFVSQQPNIADLLRDIASQVGLEKEKWEHNLESNLFEFLRHKRYVIVIDDLWQTEPWDYGLKIGIPRNSGSRIILTSRNRYVGIHVGGERSLHELRPLGPEKSRNLFFTMVRARGAPSPGNVHETSDLLPPALESIGEQILKRCSGVPLAIVVTAGLLSSRQRTTLAWNGVLERMGEDEDQYSNVFALSYKDLPTKLKPCFLYFGLFPEDHEISAFEVINFWAAEGFIRGSEGREVEDVGDDYLNHLIARNLIQLVRRSFNGRVRSCRIHDILHNLCIRVANEIDFFHIEPSNIVTATHNHGLRVRRVATHHSRNCIYLNYRTPKLRALICSEEAVPRNHGGRRVKNSLRDFTRLRVLSYKSNFFPLYFQIEVGNLRQLSYLALGGTRVELPTTIRNLKSLLTLDVRECNGVILPTVVWNMKQLKHILLPFYGDVHSSHVPKSNEQVPIEIDLPNLQTLYGKLPDLLEDDWLRKLTDLRTLRIDGETISWHNIEILSGATPVSQSLEKLHLSYGGFFNTRTAHRVTATLNLSQCENLCKLHLRLQMRELPKLAPNLIKLTLEDTYLETDPMGTLKRLPKLKILKLGRNSYWGSEMVCSGEPGNFPQLEVLKMDHCDLAEFIVEEGGMPMLKEFIIHRCSPTLKIPDRIKNIITRT